jgi:hypothetical protein
MMESATARAGRERAGLTAPAPNTAGQASGAAAGRHGARRLLALALLLGISCQRAAQTAAPAADPVPEAAATADRVRVFLIAPQDGGHAGRKAACGDSVVPVEVALPRPEPALEGALRALLAMADQYDRASGLLNPLYASHLELAGVERQGAQVKVRLTGYVELGNACDNSRMLAELTETALQFRGISYVQLELDGQPMRGLLLGESAPAPPPQTAPAPVPPPPPAPPGPPAVP